MKKLIFQTDKEVKAVVRNWLRSQAMEFHTKQIDFKQQCGRSVLQRRKIMLKIKTIFLNAS